MADPSILGTNPANARSFAATVPTGTGSALADIAKGGYYLVSTVDAWFKLSKSGGGVVAVPGSSQPAATSQNGAQFLPANTVVPLGVDYDSAQFSVIAVSSAGTLNVSGPLTIPRVPG